MGENIGIWGWDEVALPLISQWRKIHVNAVGDVQVDVKTSALPLGAASAANQVITNADLTAMIAAQGHCYGWDGAAWQELLVESAALKNLRVKLYDGANGIGSNTWAVNFAATDRGLNTAAGLYAYDGTYMARCGANKPDQDGLAAHTRVLETMGYLFGFNGATLDRLRSWGVGILKTGRAPIDSTTIRKTVAGAVVAGAHNLYWISCSPDAPGAEFTLTDATEALQDVVFDHFDPDKHSEILNFDPPIKFATGIWVEKFDHIHSLVFCYD